MAWDFMNHLRMLAPVHFILVKKLMIVVCFAQRKRKKKRKEKLHPAWTTKVVSIFLFVLLLFPAGTCPLVLLFGGFVMIDVLYLHS